jgi:long-chain acyl-CoA synthetase
MTGAWLGSIFRELPALRNNARALVAALPRLGAADPSTVVLLARNSFLPLEVTMAVALTGARVVPVSPHGTAKELDFLLRDSGARIAIGDADLLEAMRDVLDGVVTIAQRTPDKVADAYGIAADSRQSRGGRSSPTCATLASSTPDRLKMRPSAWPSPPDVAGVR